MGKLDGRIAVVTGGTSGIGLMTNGSVIDPHDLGLAPPRAHPPATLREARHHAERTFVLRALLRANGNISLAARHLGV